MTNKTASLTQLPNVQDDHEMMNGWTVPQVTQTVMHNGYWFVICASIESAWDLCDSKLLAGELTPDQEQVV